MEILGEGTLSLGVKERLTPSLVMVTVRMQPPEEPSLARAWPTARLTKSSHCSADIPGRQNLSQKPVMYPDPEPPAHMMTKAINLHA